MTKSQTGGSNPAARKIINIITGDVFNTIKEVLPLVGLKRTTFQAMLNNRSPNKTNFKYYDQPTRKAKNYFLNTKTYILQKTLWVLMMNQLNNAH